MQLRRWIIAVVVALVGGGAPLCALACSAHAATQSAHHDVAEGAGAACHDAMPASDARPTPPPDDSAGCGAHCDARTVASGVDLGLERSGGTALVFVAPRHVALVARAELPSARGVPGVAPPDARSVLLRKSTLLL